MRLRLPVRVCASGMADHGRLRMHDPHVAPAVPVPMPLALARHLEEEVVEVLRRGGARIIIGKGVILALAVGVGVGICVGVVRVRDAGACEGCRVRGAGADEAFRGVGVRVRVLVGGVRV